MMVKTFPMCFNEVEMCSSRAFSKVWSARCIPAGLFALRIAFKSHETFGARF